MSISTAAYLLNQVRHIFWCTALPPGKEETLQKYPYRINIGAGAFIGAAALALLITLITVSAQSIKAALANPVKSLRTE